MTNVHRTVWKYPIPVQDDPVTIEIPGESEILHVDRANGYPAEVSLWAIVTPESRLERRVFVVRGTGHPVPADTVHRGTVVAGLGLVWHVFEVLA